MWDWWLLYRLSEAIQVSYQSVSTDLENGTYISTHLQMLKYTLGKLKRF